MLAIQVGLLLLAGPVLAGPNPSVSLAMHVVASDEYLDCGSLAETMDCEDIDNCATVEEIGAIAYGYAYVYFLAYDFNGVTALEFALTGWPTGRGAPSTPTLHYCGENAPAFGDPWADGVAVAGLVASEAGVVPAVEGATLCFAWMGLDANAMSAYWPLQLSYAPSSYTTEPAVGNKIAGPGPAFEPELVDGEHGCTIGGEHPEAVIYSDCEAPVAVDHLTWSGLKAIYR
jgi:hypothetical protein